MTPVYLDHNATTPIAEPVFEAMLPFLRQHYGNAASRHGFGTTALHAVDRARQQVAAAVSVQPSQVIFTSGGTEANNLFVQGAAACLKPSQIAVSAIEHPCVAKPAAALARRGWSVHRIAVDAAGRVVLADLEEVLAKPTGIVSVMLANNETGVLQDVAGAAALARARGALIHSDAVQAVGKVPVDFARLGVDALTLSAHKIYGPKGVGALVVHKRLQIEPILLGGSHERGLRSGTLNVPAIVGFGAACELAVVRQQELAERLRPLRDRLEAGAQALGAAVFGADAERLPNTSYFALPGIEGETLVVELDRAGYAVASGAACSSANPEPSATLLAMGVAPDLARGAVRVSLGEPSTAADVEGFLGALGRVVERLRSLTALTA
ncbi:MAG: cysteine desulfurase family protein [Burkholderiales bacterium]